MIVAANWAGICRAQLATISEMHRQETDCYRNSPGSAGREVTVYWQCCIWDVGWNVVEVFSPLLPARSKGTAVFFNEIVGVAWVKPASIWSSTVCFTLQLALICSSSAVFLQYLVHELEWLSGPQLVHTIESRQLIGEFWYDLSLLAEAAPAEEIAPLECELGRTQETRHRMILRYFYVFQTDFNRTEQNTPFGQIDAILRFGIKIWELHRWQWWFIMGYLWTWQDSSNNGAHWQSHRTRSGMELRMRVVYLHHLEIFAIQESFVHVHRRPWRILCFFLLQLWVPSNGEVLKHRSTNKINFKAAKSRDWSQGRDVDRQFLVSSRVWGLGLVCGKVHFVSGLILLKLLFLSNHFTFVSVRVHHETEHFLLGAMQVLNNRVVLPPLESTDITIEYSPSSLGAWSTNIDVLSQPSRLASFRQSIS